MVDQIRIFFEGDKELRQGFRTFFSSIVESARERKIRMQLIPCGAQAVSDFMTAMRKYPDSFNILLIDSEGPDNGNLIAKVRLHDHWQRDVGAKVNDDQIHFMVQVMEAWFLADRQALREYYGANFQENRLPRNPRVEQIRKDDAIGGLEAATRDTTKGKYSKTLHAPRILNAIALQKVSSAAPGCARLFNVLNIIIAQPT